MLQMFNFRFLVGGFKLYPLLESANLCLFVRDFVFFGVDDVSEDLRVCFEVFLFRFLRKQVLEELLDAFFARAFEVAEDFLGDADSVAQCADIPGDPLDILDEVIHVLVEVSLDLHLPRLLPVPHSGPRIQL